MISILELAPKCGSRTIRHRLRIRLRVAIILGAIGCSASAPLQGAATFTPLGAFVPGHSVGYDVSADGSVVVGVTDSGVFRWTATETKFHTADRSARAAVSADGSVVVGAFQAPDFSSTQAFRWTAAGSFELLGDLPGGPTSSGASDVSADGSVVVGSGTTAVGSEAFRWTRATGMVGLGDLPGGETGSGASGVSADGNVIVGASFSDGLAREAFRWTAGTGMVGLGRVPGANESQATSVSADGSVVVGFSTFPGREPVIEAFRWTELDGMVGLGDLTGLKLFSEAYDVSANGSVVVGTATGLREDGVVFGKAFYWTPDTGMLDLKELLIFGGATNLDGWQLGQAWGVAYDGLTVVGHGAREGRSEAFVATIGAIPEPSTIVLAVIAAAGVLGLCIRKRRFGVDLEGKFITRPQFLLPSRRDFLSAIKIHFFVQN